MDSSLKKLFPKEFFKLDLESFDLNRIKVLNLPFNFRFNLKGGWIDKDGNWYYPIITSKMSTIRPWLQNLKNNDPFSFALKNGHILQQFDQPEYGTFSFRPSSSKTISFSFDPRYTSRNALLKVRDIAKLYDMFFNNLKFEIKTPVYKDGKVYGFNIKKFNGLLFFLMAITKFRNAANV